MAVTSASLYVAFTLTALSGIVNVVLIEFSFVKLTPSAVVHLSNTCPGMAGLAEMLTFASFS